MQVFLFFFVLFFFNCNTFLLIFAAFESCKFSFLFFYCNIYFDWNTFSVSLLVVVAWFSNCLFLCMTFYFSVVFVSMQCFFCLFVVLSSSISCHLCTLSLIDIGEISVYVSILFLLFGFAIYLFPLIECWKVGNLDKLFDRTMLRI